MLQSLIQLEEVQAHSLIIYILLIQYEGHLTDRESRSSIQAISLSTRYESKL